MINTYIIVVHRGSADSRIILIPENDYEIYAFAKRLCDYNKRHILFAIGSKFFKGGSDQFTSNLALKVNMKFGGQSHHFKPAELDKLLPKIRARIIILGVDIGHSGAGGKDGSPILACVVGSIDSNFMLYPGSMRLQSGGPEVSPLPARPEKFTDKRRTSRTSICIPWSKTVFEPGTIYTGQRTGPRTSSFTATVFPRASSRNAWTRKSPRSRKRTRNCLERNYSSRSSYAANVITHGFTPPKRTRCTRESECRRPGHL
jgi:hypothetical protein